MARLGQIENISKMHATSQNCIAEVSCSGAWRGVEQSAGKPVCVEVEVGKMVGVWKVVLGW